MPKVMFFDLDGTLWDSKHPLLKTAWDRLPQTWNKIAGDLPNTFDWSKLAGSTDYAVVKQLIELQFSSSSHADKKQRIQQVISGMDSYYLKNAPTDIRPALYKDTLRGLQQLLDQGWTLGIITGNSKSVAEHKLHAAGLLELFTSNHALLFYGEDYQSRAEMMKEAWIQSMLFGSDLLKIPPLIYVADTLRDLTESNEAWWKQSRSYFSLEYRILLRLNPAMYPQIENINDFNSGYKDIAVQLFGTIGDEHFTQTVNREGRFDWIRTKHLEWGY